MINSAHEHFPVAEANLDNVYGDRARQGYVGGTTRTVRIDLRPLVQPALFVPNSTAALKLLEQLRSASGNLALVMDEYGGLVGMVTLFDMMEAIIGEISVRGGPVEPMAIQREDGSWLVDGTMPVDQFKDLLDLDKLPEEERIGYQTVARLHARPNRRDSAARAIISSAKDHRFEVMDMDGLRVDKVLVDKRDKIEPAKQK